MKVFEKLTNLFRGHRPPGATAISKLEEALAVLSVQAADLNEKFSRLIEASDNEAQLLGSKFDRADAGLANQSSLLKEKLSALIEGSSNQSQLLSSQSGDLLASLNSLSNSLSEKLAALAEGSSRQSNLLDIRLSALAEASMNQSQLLTAKFDQVVAGMNNQSNLLGDKLSALVQGSSTQSELLDAKFDQVVAGLNNQSNLLGDKLSALVQASSTQSELLDAKFGQVVAGLNNQSNLFSGALSALVQASSTQSELLDAKFDQVVAGLNNQSRLLNRKLSTLVEASSNESQLLGAKFDEFVAGVKNQSSVLNENLSRLSALLTRVLIAPRRGTEETILPRDRVSTTQGRIIIAGTGRAGTTFLVQLFTALGFATGFSLHEALSGTAELSHAGLEHMDLRDAKNPYVIKSPEFAYQLMEALGERKSQIYAAIIPVRSLFEAAESRRRVYREADSRGLDPLAQPGSLSHTDQPSSQEEILAQQFYNTIFPLLKYEVPIFFAEFPRLASDPDYLFERLEPLMSDHDVSRSEFLAAHGSTVRPQLVHVFS